jgi:hypothetical protein
MTAPQTMTQARIDPDPLSPLNQMQRYLVHEFVETTAMGSCRGAN